jgi:hypothetical protein
LAADVAVSSAQVARWQADPDRRTTRPEDRKRRGRATHYEPVPCVARGLEVRVYVGVCKVLPVAIIGC